MTILFSNNAETTLQVAALVADTTMTVKAGDSGLFNVLAAGQTELVTLTDGVNYEVIEITAWAGDVATVIRGVEGTAQAWGIGTLFSGRVTAGALAKMAQTADLPPIPVPKGVITVVSSGGALFDMATLTDVPDTILNLNKVAPNTVFKLPHLVAGETKRIDIIHVGARIDVAVQTGDFLDGVLNGTNFTSAWNAMALVGNGANWYTTKYS